ncbi:M4 family metallopeptidase [Kitasatospora sp. NPDC056446]|uniref:M4 family metallopeptidase n=1 Tax=Kitasatospora sp. NPDC056446 TaxID=3345819 RepID=UPI00369E00A2
MTSSPALPARQIYDARSGDRPGKLVLQDGGTTQDGPATRAYENLGIVAGFFQEQFGRRSYDGQNAVLKAVVHAGTGGNAYWDGTHFNFADGDASKVGDPATVLDVVGHMYTEAVIQTTAGLEFYGQSGALLLSIADVLGLLVKQKHLGQTVDKADWLLGVGLFKDKPDTGIRSLKDPSLHNQPAHLRDYDDTPSDNGGVHTNSGIPNHAFYLLATDLGGQAWEAAGRIWYAALTRYAGQDTDFAGFAQATAAAAKDLFGDDHARRVQAAWKSVGID